jgi:hypothetical protein
MVADNVRHQSEVGSKLHHPDVVGMVLRKFEQELKTRITKRILHTCRLSRRLGSGLSALKRPLLGETAPAENHLSNSSRRPSYWPYGG